MLVLGIDETTTNTRRDINQVEFDDTGNGSPVLFVQTVTRTLLGSDFQIYTRGQRHLVMTVTVVASAIVLEGFFPVIERSIAVNLTIGRTLIFRIVGGVVSSTSIWTMTIITEVHVAGQGTQIVHDIINTEVVTVDTVLSSQI